MLNKANEMKQFAPFLRAKFISQNKDYDDDFDDAFDFDFDALAVKRLHVVCVEIVIVIFVLRYEFCA